MPDAFNVRPPAFRPGGSRKAFLFGTVQTAAVVAGYCVGQTMHHPGDPPHRFTILFIVAGILFFFGTFQALGVGRQRAGWLAPIAIVGVVLYSWVIVGLEVCPAADSVASLIFELALLVPLLVAGMGFARIDCWFAAAATAVLVFDYVMMLTFNSHTSNPVTFWHKVRY